MITARVLVHTGSGIHPGASRNTSTNICKFFWNYLANHLLGQVSRFATIVFTDNSGNLKVSDNAGLSYPLSLFCLFGSTELCTSSCQCCNAGPAYGRWRQVLARHAMFRFGAHECRRMREDIQKDCSFSISKNERGGGKNSGRRLEQAP